VDGKIKYFIVIRCTSAQKAKTETSLTPPSESQELHRLKWAMATPFESKNEAARIGFRPESKKKSQTTINRLINPVFIPSLKLLPAGTGKLKWKDDRSRYEVICDTDLIYLLVYNETKD
jgi:hypothetical protein